MDFPLRWKRLWNDWDLRAVILFSLWLQIVLIFSGSLRKRIASRWISFVLWSAYLLADWVAVFALGILSNDQDVSSPNRQLLAFWSPFLLLHLGGPDTITAFSLEDNELWMRHLFGLVFQVGLALYVFVRSEPETRLTAPAVLMFVSGVLKYGERTWALMCASMDSLRNSMVTPPDPGPNYAKFMEEYASKIAAGIPAEIEMEKEPASNPRFLDMEMEKEPAEEQINNAAILSKAHHFFRTFRRLVVDLILSFHDRNESQSFFLKRTPSQSFKVIEIELSFVYEALYTKSLVIHTACGPFLRCITFSSILVALIRFLSVEKKGYKPIDVGITYTLLGGALVLESYSVCILVLSDWAYLWLKRLKLYRASNMVYRAISVFRPPGKARWSNSMSQHNLLSFCLRDQPSTAKKILNYFSMKDVWDRFWHTGCCPVSDELKKFIFAELKNKACSAEDSRGYKRLSACRGEWALQMKGYRKELGWSVGVEFDESILLWHIATDLCYYYDGVGEPREAKRMSKEISDYMLYLLVVRPFMLTAGIGQIRYGDTCAEAKNFFDRGEATPDEREACEMLLLVETKVPPVQVKGDRSKSVLFDACRLAKALMDLKEKKWGVIGVVWVEMLGYAANNCRGFFHAKQLSAGGELLTHVWLLMAHLGIGEHYRIEAGHARAKLIVEK
uniref:1-phosphatidylinositol 4,5-bisphosphate phosphodiesterase beta-1 n=1 Tax=Anthurium amnicola TaxID=1678845 RepID=A0A1D1ZKL5_9ARAE